MLAGHLNLQDSSFGCFSADVGLRSPPSNIFPNMFRLSMFQDANIKPQKTVFKERPKEATYHRTTN